MLWTITEAENLGSTWNRSGSSRPRSSFSASLCTDVFSHVKQQASCLKPNKTKTQSFPHHQYLAPCPIGSRSRAVCLAWCFLVFCRFGCKHSILENQSCLFHSCFAFSFQHNHVSTRPNKRATRAWFYILQNCIAEQLPCWYTLIRRHQESGVLSSPSIHVVALWSHLLVSSMPLPLVAKWEAR